MKKQDVIKEIEDSVTDMEYRHYINPDFDLSQKWSISFGYFVNDSFNRDRLYLKKIKKDRGIINLSTYADEFQKTTIWKGKKFKENRKVEYEIFFNLDTDSVNIFIHFYYAPTRKGLELLYDTAKQSVEEIVDDYYIKLETLLKNEENEKNN